MLTIKNVESREIWDNFVIKNTSDTFLQSWSWGDFNLSLGQRIWRLGLYYQNSLKFVLLAIKTEAKRGAFLFIPHGPVFDRSILPEDRETDEIKGIKNGENLKEYLNFAIDYLVKIAIGENCAFIRISPILKNTHYNNRLFKDLGLIEAPIHIHSELSWVLNISPPEETILRQMRKTTRYLIRQGQREQISIKRTTDPDDINKFYQMFKETEKRHRFVAFDLKYLKRELEAFSDGGGATLYLAFYKGYVLSGAIIVKYGRSAFYHHGASATKFPKIPASYLLHWQIISDLKKDGFSFYNFWGIAPEDKPYHPWAGITLFKKGFGGESREYIHSKDYILKPSYAINWIIETLRRIKRRY